jgi:hypothetical protein
MVRGMDVRRSAAAGPARKALLALAFDSYVFAQQLPPATRPQLVSAMKGQQAIEASAATRLPASTRRPRRRRGESLPADMGLWLAAAAFGPYVLKGVGLRADHIAIYIVGVVGILRLLTSRNRRSFNPLPIVGFFGLTLVWALFVTFLTNSDDATMGRVIADVDHYMRPAMIVLGLVGWLDSDPRRRAQQSLRRVCIAVVVMLSISAVLASLSLFMDVGALLDPFRPISTTSDPNVADQSLQMGRHVGVFNQPFEAGVAYTLGLFAWAYLYTGSGSKQPGPFPLVGLALIMLGGALPVSKAFLLGGLPLFLIYWVSSGGLAATVRVSTLPVVAVAVFGIVTIFASWSGSEFISSQYQDIFSDGLVSSLSAGRFGDEGVVSSEFTQVAQESPLTGIGLGRVRVLDSAFFMYFVHGGVLPLLAYIGFLAWLIGIALQNRSPRRESSILLLVGIYVAGASFGAPVSSIVRSSTVLWVMVSLILIALSSNELPLRQSERRP